MINTTEESGAVLPDGSLSANMLKAMDLLVTQAIERSMASTQRSLDALNREMTEMRSDLSRELRSLKDGQERQESRLSAIESFPRVAISQPPRLYGTQAQSVSSPKRVRTGYAG